MLQQYFRDNSKVILQVPDYIPGPENSSLPMIALGELENGDNFLTAVVNEMQQHMVNQKESDTVHNIRVMNGLGGRLIDYFAHDQRGHILFPHEKLQQLRPFLKWEMLGDGLT